jgi:hypothetical protein
MSQDIYSQYVIFPRLDDSSQLIHLLVVHRRARQKKAPEIPSEIDTHYDPLQNEMLFCQSAMK